METQRDELLDQLAKQGWEATPVERAELEWWADEMWLLVSQWSPVGATAYLTFMVDPMYSGDERKKGQHVNEAVASGGKLLYYGPLGPDSFGLGLGQGWRERMPELLAHLSGLRSRRKAEGIDG